MTSRHGGKYTGKTIVTSAAEVVPASVGSISISVPIEIRKRSGRKLVALPGNSPQQPRPWDDKPTPLQLALARGHQWLSWRESGKAASLSDIAKQVGVDNSYVSRMFNLTVLAPDIVEAILELAGIEPAGTMPILLLESWLTASGKWLRVVQV